VGWDPREKEGERKREGEGRKGVKEVKR